MPPEIYLLSAIIIAIFIAGFWWLSRQLKPDENLVRIISDLQKLSPQLNSTLGRTAQDFNLRLDNAAKYIREVAKEVGQMNELGQSMRDLQIFLQSPKLRGNIGEQVLKDLISQSFPQGSFHLQYSFKSGDKVDVVLKTSAGILPIDSKFPLENFRRLTTAPTRLERAAAKKEFVRDVKKHIDAIAKKYILPEEGTLDLAIMYIPSESVYHEIANLPEVLEYARRSRIYPASPNTLYMMLQSLLLSFEGQKLEARSRDVFRLLRAIQKDYLRASGVLDVLGKHINNSYNAFNNVAKSFSLLGQKLESSHQLEPAEKIKQLE